MSRESKKAMFHSSRSSDDGTTMRSTLINSVANSSVQAHPRLGYAVHHRAPSRVSPLTVRNAVSQGGGGATKSSNTRTRSCARLLNTSALV
jgi:hypothetical protein